MSSMMAGMGLWMLLWAVLFVALIAAAVVGVVALFRRQDSPTLPPAREAVGPTVESPEQILKRRYAAGEIDEDEYFRRMSGLAQH